jgi:hypothetical protein
MYAWIVRRIFEGLIARLNRGDLALLERPLAPDVALVFAGRSSFAGEHRGKPRSWRGCGGSSPSMEYVRVRKGRLAEIRVHLDTQKVAELDERLESAAVAS